jgi:nucleotide-binding universal stress UspA family protein
LGIRGKVARLDELPPGDRAADEEQVRGRIESIYGGASDVAFDTVVRYGPEANEILRFSARVGAQLIVVGARGIGAVEALFGGGSVADRLLRESWVPLLVVPG